MCLDKLLMNSLVVGQSWGWVGVFISFVCGTIVSLISY